VLLTQAKTYYTVELLVFVCWQWRL